MAGTDPVSDEGIDPMGEFERLVDEIAANLGDIRRRIRRAGGADSIEIVAVTKGHDATKVHAAYLAGARLFGENYADEVVAKAASPVLADVEIAWTFQGRLQTNKINRLKPIVSLWQTVDTFERGQALQTRVPNARVLVQLNLTGAPQRSGVALDDADELVFGLRRIGLEVEGVMGIGPESESDALSTAEAFRLAVDFADRHELRTRSLGMSDDFEEAVAVGATMVRIGSALFGAREP